MTKVEQLAHIYTELTVAAEAQQLPLATQAGDIVPGEGSPTAEVLFIGEAPGYHESVQHRPFVGRSGQLFRQQLQPLGMNEAEVYISNIVKVRPPDNRDPSAEEIVAFRPYLDREIEVIQPLLIVTLGRYSMAKFLPDVKISQVHGRLHKVTWKERNQFVLPMYHPAAALRAPLVKAAFIQDFQKIPKVVAWIKEQTQDDQIKATIKEALF